jgi:hypothetical protein
MGLLAVKGTTGRFGRGRRLLMVAACLSVLTGAIVHAGGEEKMPAPRFASFLARMLTYDTNLKKRVGERLTIAVLYEGKDAISVAEGSELAAALKNLELVKILDLPVATLGVAFTDAATLEKAVRLHGIDVFVVGGGLHNQTALIKKVSEKGKILTIGTSSDQVRVGLSIAAYLDNGKSKLMVNLPASKSEGVSFGGELLGLAEVIR